MLGDVGRSTPQATARPFPRERALDDVDIASIPRGVLRDRIGMVLQDTWLFAGTIRDNIAYGRPGATEVGGAYARLYRSQFESPVEEAVG